MFWSYKKWFAGNWAFGREILYNIAMFVPIGFFLGALLNNRKNGLPFACLVGLFLSATIELLQMFFKRGLCELDDVFSNTLGTMLGYGIYKLASAVVSQQKRKYFVLSVDVLCVIICLAVCVYMETPVDSSARSYCFQVDTVRNEKGNLAISGFSFIYDKDTPIGKFSLTLKDTHTGEKKKLKSETGLNTRDVNDYFLCGLDYSMAGYTAQGSGISVNDEYEILVSMGGWSNLHTGAFIKGDKIKYCSESNFIWPDVVGTDIEEVVDKGYLRVYRPDYHCYVYQYDGNLYWIVDEDFDFKDSGKTCIQYQLWTTQIENLPKHRLDHEWYWDNIGFNFEDYEITDDIDCGKYRVSRRELPTEYSITAIVTGYHENGKWIWENYFRPYYIFG